MQCYPGGFAAEAHLHVESVLLPTQRQDLIGDTGLLVTPRRPVRLGAANGFVAMPLLPGACVVLRERSRHRLLDFDVLGG